MKTIRIFVSSPQDVLHERKIVDDVLEKIKVEYGGRLRIEPFFWEEKVCELQEPPQAHAPLTSEFDIVVCILWSRLGSMLDPVRFKKTDGQPYRSGTEFELETALAAFLGCGKPRIFLFRSISDPLSSLRDDEIVEKKKQFDELNKYLDDLLGKKFLTHSANDYRDAYHFERLLTKSLTEELERCAEGEILGNRCREAINPFRGLKFFDYEHARFYFGRNEAKFKVIEALYRRAKEGCAFVMIFGSSGLGKSSLVRAGILRWLPIPDENYDVRFCRRLILTPAMATDGDLFRLLASKLLEEKVLPKLEQTPDSAGLKWNVFSLVEMLRFRPHAASQVISEALVREAEILQNKERLRERPLGRLILFIDQFEEIFSKKFEPMREEFLRLVDALARGGSVWVLATARSDFFAQCEASETLLKLKDGLGTFHLNPPSPAELGEMIRRPAYEVGLLFEHDQKTGKRLDDVLVDEASGNPHALPLLEFALSRLYEETPLDATKISFETYYKINGFQGALATHAENCFKSAFVEDDFVGQQCQMANEQSNAATTLDREAHQQVIFGAVARQLVAIGSGEGERPIRKFADKRSLDSDPSTKLLTARLIEDRLLVVTVAEAKSTTKTKTGAESTSGTEATSDGSEKRVSVSVAHEALLTCWPRLQNWIDAHRQTLKVRDRVVAESKFWLEKNRDKHRLIKDWSELKEAERLLEQKFLDGENEREFVEKSLHNAVEEYFIQCFETGEFSNPFSDRRGSYPDIFDKVLAWALESDSNQARRNAARFLGHEPVSEVTRKLLRLVVSDKNDKVRQAAAYSLLELQDHDLFKELLETTKSQFQTFEIVGALARIQIAAELSSYISTFSDWLARLSKPLRFRVWLGAKALRFKRAMPAFLLIVVCQLVLTVPVAGIAKMILGCFAFSFVQEDKSAAEGIFGGVVAAVFWGTFITFGIALHHFVFSSRHQRRLFPKPVPARAYCSPFWTIVFGTVFGLIGSSLVILLVAGVFNPKSLYEAGWSSLSVDNRASADYSPKLWHDLFFVTGYVWPYLFMGPCLGAGMALMANGLQASQEWATFKEIQERLVNWTQVTRMIWRMIRRGISYAWPIPLALSVGCLLAFGSLRHFPKQKASGPPRDFKISAVGQALGIAGDGFTQALGGFFCIVGMGVGFIVLSKGMAIEPGEDL